MASPSFVRAIKLKCRDCMGNYQDGRHDCRVPTCSLYFWMPYRELEPDLTWAVKKTATPAQLAAGARLLEARKAKKAP